MQTDEIQRIERAKHYPYAVPAGSYVFANRCALPLVQVGEDPLALGAMVIEEPSGERRALQSYAANHGIADEELRVLRTPVLCYASNTSREALARKFAAVQQDVVIPVVEGTLKHFDAVFSAHISSYGSIPATLQWSPDTELRVFMLMMTDRQLEIMHLTEGPYDFVELEELELTLEKSPIRRSAFTYVSKNGGALVDGSETALSTLPAAHRRFGSATELEVLSWMRDELSPETAIDSFILEQILDPHIRKCRTDWLHGTSRDLEWDHWSKYQAPI